MSNVMDAFAHLDAMSQTQLFERRVQLIGGSATGDYKDLSDEALGELVAIARVLRRKTATGKPTLSRKAANSNLIPSLDNL
jgi:hypothetical protein